MAPSVPAVSRTIVSTLRIPKSRAVIGIRDFATANESTDGTYTSFLDWGCWVCHLEREGV